MILTVTLNPALDVTYHVPALRPGGTHRVSRVDQRPGGKGLNVAHVLSQLGEPVLATGLLGGATGERMSALLDLPHEFHGVAGETRRTVVAADGHSATGFWEPGPLVTAQEWRGFRELFARLARDARVVVLSGSLPEGVPLDAYAQLIEVLSDTPSILDTSGEALALGVAAGPDVVKPNADELPHLGEVGPHTTVVASYGADGLVARGPYGLPALRARPPFPVAGNPTGAGDACVAALARALSHGHDRQESLRDAVALSAAAVAAPVAGVVDLELYRTIQPQVQIEEV